MPDPIRHSASNLPASDERVVVGGLPCLVRNLGCLHQSFSQALGTPFELRCLVCQVVNTSAVVLQEYVPGRDVRVHVVQESAFGTEIVSKGVDYRYHTETAVFRTIEVPPVLAEACQKVAGMEELLIAGFDFRLSPSGEWHCLEVNPVPTFLPYEMSTGQAIGDAVLGALSMEEGVRLGLAVDRSERSKTSVSRSPVKIGTSC